MVTTISVLPDPDGVVCWTNGGGGAVLCLELAATGMAVAVNSAIVAAAKTINRGVSSEG